VTSDNKEQEKNKARTCINENSIRVKNVPQTLTMYHFCISHHQGDA